MRTRAPDRRHIFTANYIYELPFFRDSTNALVKATLGGWQMSGITTISPGAPVPRILVNDQRLPRGNRANVDRRSQGRASWSSRYWFDPAAFAPPAEGTYGNSPRAPLRLPGTQPDGPRAVEELLRLGQARSSSAPTRSTRSTTRSSRRERGRARARRRPLNRCAFGGTHVRARSPARALPREMQFSLKLYW